MLRPAKSPGASGRALDVGVVGGRQVGGAADEPGHVAAATCKAMPLASRVATGCPVSSAARASRSSSATRGAWRCPTPAAAPGIPWTRRQTVLPTLAGPGSTPAAGREKPIDLRGHVEGILGKAQGFFERPHRFGTQRGAVGIRAVLLRLWRPIRVRATIRLGPVPRSRAAARLAIPRPRRGRPLRPHASRRPGSRSATDSVKVRSVEPSMLMRLAS